MNTNRRKEILFGAAFVVLVVGLMIVAGMASNGTSTQPSEYVGTQTSAIVADDHIKGDPNSPVSIIIYGDYQCPACAAYEPVLKRLESEYAGKVAFVFRNFPLYQAHPNAEIAAKAAEAAALQGKFWEMHDMLYAKQTEWSGKSTGSVVENYFSKYAAAIGLDMQKFNTDINSDTVKEKIFRDLNGGNAAEVDHTPTFFINLTQIKNPSGYDEFKSIIDSKLAPAQ